MEQIKEYIKNKKVISGKFNKRYEVIKVTARMLRRPIGQMFSILKDWKTDWIEEMYLTCHKEDNPERLWWGLRKKVK